MAAILSIASKLDLPFKLETKLEEKIASDPRWQTGIQWGHPRLGHPEGKVSSHIADVLGNVNQFFNHSSDRSRLRLIALIHDTFKYKVVSYPGARKQPHGLLAREFAEKYIDDNAILQVIERHDDAYKASRLITKPGGQIAEEQVKALIAQLENALGLYLCFYLCDNRTEGKSSDHYHWFKRLAEEYGSRFLR